MKINLVMIVRDEAERLERCLDSARGLVDRMIVVDTGSEDNTASIARRMGAEVYHFVWTGDFSAARNAALAYSDGDWNLILDGDEWIVSGTRDELKRWLSGRQKCLGGILRQDCFRDGKTGEMRFSSSYLPRLLPCGVRYTGMIHEQPDSCFPMYASPLAVKHDGYLQEGKGKRNLQYLLQAEREHPEDGYYQYQVAVTLRNLNQLENSLPYFRRFYSLSDGGEGYWQEGVLLYLYTLVDLAGDLLQEAGGLFESNEIKFRKSPDFYFLRGLYYMKLVLSDVKRYIGCLGEIEESWKKCLEIGDQEGQGSVKGTGSYLALYNLGVWYEVTGQSEQAKEYYGRAAKEGYEPALRRLEAL